MINTESIPAGTLIETDLCVVGAGPAALAVARGFAGGPHRLHVLAGGGFHYEQQAQDLYRGEITGMPQPPLHRSRLRAFGGTGNIWSGRTGALSEIDIEARSWVPHSGWPFSRSYLDPFYDRANEFCGLELGPAQLLSWEKSMMGMLPLDTERVVVRALGSEKPLDFGQAYRPLLSNARNVSVIINASAVEFHADPSEERVEVVEVANADGSRYQIAARVFVLACGGIENPRLLLASRSVHPTGLGNQYDLVGRFFMDHPFVMSGILRPGENSFPIDAFSFEGPEAANKPCHGLLTLSDSVVRREAILNCAAFFVHRVPRHTINPSYASSGVRAVQEIMADLRHRERPERPLALLKEVTTDLGNVVTTAGIRLAEPFRRPLGPGIRVMVEPSPQPDSRVILSDRKDQFGYPRARVDWRTGSADLHSYQRFIGILSDEFSRLDLGDVSLFEGVRQDGWPILASGGSHHMGTTRMHISPRHGVVNTDCRVHGVANLFVAGSSVFPTAGYANPTLTIVALALRLADHLKTVLGCR